MRAPEEPRRLTSSAATRSTPGRPRQPARTASTRRSQGGRRSTRRSTKTLAVLLLAVASCASPYERPDVVPDYAGFSYGRGNAATDVSGGGSPLLLNEDAETYAFHLFWDLGFLERPEAGSKRRNEVLALVLEELRAARADSARAQAALLESQGRERDLAAARAQAEINANGGTDSVGMFTRILSGIQTYAFAFSLLVLAALLLGLGPAIRKRFGWGKSDESTTPKEPK